MKGEEREIFIKKLIYKAWYRGCKETDRLIGTFAKKYLNDFSDEELIQFENILDISDQDLYNYLNRSEQPPEDIMALSAFKRLYDYDYFAEALEGV